MVFILDDFKLSANYVVARVPVPASRLYLVSAHRSSVSAQVLQALLIRESYLVLVIVLVSMLLLTDKMSVAQTHFALGARKYEKIWPLLLMYFLHLADHHPHTPIGSLF